MLSESDSNMETYLENGGKLLNKVAPISQALICYRLIFVLN